MEKLIQYLEQYIFIYRNSTDDFERLNAVRNIYSLYILCSSNYKYRNNSYYNFIRLYKEVSGEKEFNELKQIQERKFSDKLDSILVKDNDIDYLFYLLKIINLEGNIYKYNIGDYDLLNYYIGNDIDYNTIRNMIRNTTLFDKAFKESFCLNLTDKNLLILNESNIVTYLHEITHCYTNDINNIYTELGSILMEKGLESFYGLGDNNDRLLLLKNIKFLNSEFVKYNKVEYQILMQYVIGIVFSISYIYKYGDDFVSIKNAIDYIINNSFLEIIKLFQSFNISEKDIVESFNNKEKILVK